MKELLGYPVQWALGVKRLEEIIMMRSEMWGWVTLLMVVMIMSWF